MNGAGAAHADAAAELGPDQIEAVAQNPEHWSVRSDVYGAGLPVDIESELAHGLIKRREAVRCYLPQVPIY